MTSISIPLWYDYKGDRATEIANANLISIPLWYDYKTNRLCWKPFNRFISIPLWYDYKQMGDMAEISLNDFNSSMVRL